MTNNFYKQLSLALAIDYYFVSYMTESGRGQGLYLLISTHLKEPFKNLLGDLGCEFGIYEYTEDPENFYWIEFGEEQDKDRAEKYFEAFQFANRINEMIVKPNLYEGEKMPKQEICNWYLHAIEEFFKNDLKGEIPIPFGINETYPNERNFMVYTEDGIKGLFKGSLIFKNSAIRFVK